jgi:hypothetical protein
MIDVYFYKKLAMRLKVLLPKLIGGTVDGLEENLGSRLTKTACGIPL